MEYKDNSLPVVSYLISAFNEEEYIAACLYSLLGQEYPNIEIIFVDDGSTDYTFDIAQKILSSQSHFVYKSIKLSKNMGKCAAYNIAFTNSLGDIITIVGADDIAPPFRTRIAVEFIGKEKCNYAYGGYSKFSNIKSFSLEPKAKLPRVNRFFYNAVPGGTSFIDRQLALDLFPIPEFLPAEDWYLSYMAEVYNCIPKYINSIFSYWRIGPGNSTSISTKISYAHALDRQLVVLNYFSANYPKMHALNISIKLRSLLLRFLAKPSIQNLILCLPCLISPIRNYFYAALKLVILEH